MDYQSNKKEGLKKTIYFDGSCPMCNAIASKIDNSSQKLKFHSKDITKDPLPDNLSREQVDKGIHVFDSEGRVYKNAEAILKILDEYPKWRIFARLGRVPVVKQMLSVGYRFVAANRHLIFGPANRLFWIKVVLAVGFLSGLLLSINLWIPKERLFPYIPVLGDFFAIPPFLEVALFFSIIGLLLAIFSFPKPQKLIFTMLAILVILALSDQMRWQPWFYQYFFMLAVLGLFSWSNGREENRDAVLNTLRLIVASIYFFSGLQKINPVFIASVFPWMVEPVVSILPDSMKFFFFSLGFLVPFVEVAIGIGLLTKKFRKHSVILALLTSVFVVFVLGPLGHGWNSVVWPWNVAMALFVLLLFWRAKEFSFKEVLWVRSFLFQKVVLVLFVFLPISSFFGLWDSYLSWSLYSGNTDRAKIFLSDSVKQKLPEEVKRFTARSGIDTNALDFFRWSFDELNVPPYPEKRVYRDLASNFCRYADNDEEVILVIDKKSTVLRESYRLIYNCSSIGI